MGTRNLWAPTRLPAPRVHGARAGDFRQAYDNIRREAGMSYQSVNPFNGETLRIVEELTDKQLEAAPATAAACYRVWRTKSYA